MELPPPLPPHADRTMPSAVAAAIAVAAIRDERIITPGYSCPVVHSPRRLMSEDLGKEVPGAVGPRLSEELLRGAVLDNLAIGHERDPVGGLASKAHLVRHH